MRPSTIKTMFTTLLICLSVFEALGQGEERVYLSATLEEAPKAQAAYYKQQAGKDGDKFIGKTFSMDGKLKVEGRYVDPDLRIEDGVFTFYHPNGKIESTGAYAQGWKSGVWQRFDQWGRPLSEKVYDPEVLANVIFTQPDQMPRYPGGDATLQTLVKTQVAEKSATRPRGKLKATFVVEKDGSLSDVKMIQGVGGNIDELAMAAIKDTRWTPGLAKGRPVRVQMTVPLQF